MKLFKYETHCHTSEGSACARSSGAEMAKHYKKIGYDGIIITDHFFNGNSAVDRNLPWHEMVEDYCKGYENAKAVGDEIGLSVFFGIEYSHNGTDLLTYGMDKQWLFDHPETMTLSINDYAELIHKSGGIIVQAHPFRQADYIDMIRLLPDCSDAVEIINISNRNPLFNERAKAYAKSFDKIGTSGSDAHSTKADCRGGIGTEQKLNSINDYISCIKNNRIMKLYY